MRKVPFVKGHATANDFIIVEDPHGMRHLTPEFVAQMCDRNTGVGADGLIRVVRAQHIPEWTGDQNLWFMDYWNADGSVAEMCGNGLRVFARFLINQQLVSPGEFTVATRDGVKTVRSVPGNLISARLGEPVVADDVVRVTVGDTTYEATPVDVGNPHAVARVSSVAELDGLDLTVQPTWEPAERFPNGVNLEFVYERGPADLLMRVHERGVGETKSCGTGVVAVAAAHRARTGASDPIEVRVPGGQLSVNLEDGDSCLVGPAVLVARGEYLNP